MPGKRTKAKECGDKVAHASKVSALAHRLQLIDRGAVAAFLKVYLCHHCNCFHVGRARPGRR